VTATITTATPLCPHFGACGGCQYQDLAYPEQLRIKRERLTGLLQDAGVAAPAITVHSADTYGYRNRIRLRLERVGGQLRFGYNVRSTTDFLPITVCPIAAPVLWSTAEAILTAAQESRDAAYWIDAAAEVELFTSHDLTRVQLTFFCAPRTKAPPAGQPGHFTNAFAALHRRAPQLAGAAAEAFDPRTGATGRTLAEAGYPGLSYNVAGETYWITRGGFFQVNRFLIDTLVQLVCTDAAHQPRTGTLAWDLYAGVGLFSRVLARSFERITAVEASPTAAADLLAGLGKLSPGSAAIQSTTLDFLRRAVLDRDRPGLIVLDPPRAGAGLEACALLNRIAAPTLVYVSCDPATLARDLAALQPAYAVAAMHLLDLFPQTSHLETVAILQRS
jgi:23S rRNA (uracil1939-C5)-methyltransferase